MILLLNDFVKNYCCMFCEVNVALQYCFDEIPHSDLYYYWVELGCYISGIRAVRSVRPSCRVVVLFNNQVLLFSSNHCLCCNDKLRWQVSRVLFRAYVVCFDLCVLCFVLGVKYIVSMGLV